MEDKEKEIMDKLRILDFKIADLMKLEDIVMKIEKDLISNEDLKDKLEELTKNINDIYENIHNITKIISGKIDEYETYLNVDIITEKVYEDLINHYMNMKMKNN